MKLSAFLLRSGINTASAEATSLLLWPDQLTNIFILRFLKISVKHLTVIYAKKKQNQGDRTFSVVGVVVLSARAVF